MHTPTTIDIRPIARPAGLAAPDAADFAANAEIQNLVDAEMYGTRDLTYEAAERLHEEATPFRRNVNLAAWVDGRMVGRAGSTVNVEPSDTAWVNLHVLPEYRGRGIGTALADAIERQVRDDEPHVRKLVSYHGVQEQPGERLPSPTGFGSVPAASAAVRFALSRGWTFEQVERVSRLALPVPDLEERLDAALAATGDQYALHTWRDRVPERWRADLADLISRMSTDAPSAGLEEPEDVWTVERLVHEEERRLRESDRRMLTAVVEHRPTGRLVAFTDLSLPAQPHRAVDQWATLVLREHRGHRLGMLVKLANLAQLAREAPQHPSVITFNAEENRPMLDVNEAIGFVPIAAEAAWRKDLA